MSCTDRSPGLSLRPVDDDEDILAAAGVFAGSRSAAIEAGTIPVGPPRSEDASRYFREDVVPDREVWLAELDGHAVGVLALDEAWLDHLYVRPGHTQRGVGGALLDLAKALRPGGFGLWAFASNAPAQTFYEHHGMVEVERTDGSGHQERRPEIRYAWQPHEAGADAACGPVSDDGDTVLLT